MDSHDMARSLKGHAATSGVDKWILIQNNTFRNWVNEQLKSAGVEVNDFENDFDDGAKLCALISSLQNKRIKYIKSPRNHHQQLANVAGALAAIADDNIRLVNIGPEDIVNGNLKLILGLVWHLILRYQIGKSKAPTKKLMLLWLQAVIPECNISNFTSDWNDGVALHFLSSHGQLEPEHKKRRTSTPAVGGRFPAPEMASSISPVSSDRTTSELESFNNHLLMYAAKRQAFSALIEFCRPGLCPDWRHLSRQDRLNNCRDAMNLAKQHFDIPLVVRPEDLSSTDLDELSGMTYLSYFMKVDSPGYHATLALVRRLLRHGTVNNFTSDWSDGRLLANLVTSVGGHVTGWPTMTGDSVENMQAGMNGAKGIGVEPLLSAKDMVDPEVDHIAIMAYAAYFKTFKPLKSASEKVILSSPPQNVSVRQEARFSITIEDDDVSAGDIRADVNGPESTSTVHFNWIGKTGEGYFVPNETGLHRLNVYCEGQVINGCPASFKVLADRSKVTFSSVESCSLGSLTELQVNSAAAGDGDVRIEARSPSGRTQTLSAVPRHGGNYSTDFNPSEVGEWQISVLYDDEHISGSPYNVSVYDPSAVKVYGLEGGTLGTALTFNADTTLAGRGRVHTQVEHEGRFVSSYVSQERDGLYKIDFTPEGAGEYTVQVFFNDVEVRGSPYNVNIADSSSITLSGDGLSLVPIHQTASFDVQGAVGSNLKVDITAPNGSTVPTSLKKTSQDGYVVQYTPFAVGDHKMNILFGGQPVKGSPYTVRVYDAGRVVVSNMPIQSIIGNPVVFDIDASKAGSGNIEIMINDGEIACSVQNHGNYKFTASFLPAFAEEHRIEMKFNAKHVPGSPWKVSVIDPGKMLALGDGLGYVHVYRPTWFSVNMEGISAKKLGVRIIAPNGTTVPFTTDDRNNCVTINYTPNEVGDHRIEVRYADVEVSGSPFVAKAYDTSAIKITSIPDGVVGQPIEFGIDVTQAGEGQLEIMVNSGNLPNTVESDVTGVYKLSFVPEEAGRQTVDIIFNAETHPSCPISCNAVDLSKSSVKGLDLQLLVDRTASFYIESQVARDDLNATVDVTSPTGQDMAVKYQMERPGLQRIEFVPKDVGVHTIHVKYLGVHIDKSPYQVKAYNPKLVLLSKMPLGILGIPFKFRVLGEIAGDGKMEVTVDAEGDRIPCDLEAKGEGTFEVTFMGQGERTHTLNILFNGIHIPGSPYSVNFSDVDKIKLFKPKSLLVPCDHQIDLQMTSAQIALDDLVIYIEGPLYNRVPYTLRNTGDRLYSIDWVPIKPGNYDVSVKYGDIIPVWGSPLKMKAFDSRKVKVMDYYCTPTLGERYLMKVDVKEAGEGDLGVVILCDGDTVQSAINKTADKGQLNVTFDLEKEKLYEIFVTFNGEPVPGSPFKIDLSRDEVDCKALALLSTKHFMVQSLQWYFLNMIGLYVPLDNLTMYITAPSGERVQASVYKEGASEYRVEWTPRVQGRHTIDVLYDGRQVSGSPFFVDVFDLSVIRVDNFRNGIVGQDAGFSVDFSVAGTLEQEVQIISPSGSEVVYDGRELGYLWKDYIYEPEEAGKFKIFIKYGGFELPGCPYIQDIDDGGMPTAKGRGLYFAEEDKPANFEVEVGRRKGDLRVSVSGPNSIAKCSVDPMADGSYGVTYIPVETGIFDINVTWNGNDIPGSPFNPKVIDVRKVRVIGGWQHFMDSNERVNLVVGEKKQLPFDISEAGPGTFRAEVQGPSRALDVDIDSHTRGRAVVEFTPEEEGSHYIHLFWSDLPLVSSPFHGYAIQHTPDASKLILTGRGLKEATVREEAEFYIDGSQAGQGTPDVVLSGVRAEVNVKTVSVGNGKFRCTYMPTIPGAYLLHITWNGRQLRGSPYKVNIMGAFYPNRVVVSGEGLRGGMLGQEISVQIDTRKAGPGELTAYCMGPHQVAYCELQDNQDGTFRLGIRAQEPGRHVMQIKYGGEHVQNSPFVFKVTQQPDASKVRVSGPGVEHGILATFISRFIVETRGAGAGQLTVRIRGPKGGFQVEMYRDSQRDRTILCRYDPMECGLYIVSIKWSGVDVPGSPFHVHICDTQDELEHVLNDVSYSMGSYGSHRSHGTGGVVPIPPQQRTAYGQWREQL